MKSLKALLLQMKIDPSSEMRILAEEEIINLFDDQKLKSQKLVEAVKDVVHYSAHDSTCHFVLSRATASIRRYDADDLCDCFRKDLKQALAAYNANNEGEKS